ncbi:MAG: nucleotidyltransferase family protein [Methylococcales bacterium]
MRALLLAAGFGTRLRPLTNSIPKCLVPIHGKPLLQYWIDTLFPSNIERALVNTHYLSERVEQFIKASNWGDSIDIIYEDELLGTGGTILKNRSFFDNQAFIVAHADNLTRFDIKRFIMAHHSRPENTEITMMTFETDDPQSCGIVELNKKNVVVAFHEKVESPPGNKANAAVYIFEPSVIEFLSKLNKNIIDLSTEVLPEYLNKIYTFHNDDYHRDIGTIESLELANKEY